MTVIYWFLGFVALAIVAVLSIDICFNPDGSRGGD